MALDIGVGDGPSMTPDFREPSLSLEDDGYYWFLHPLWARLASETGQYIDLYGEAWFAGEELAALDRALSEARRLIEVQPEEWSVFVGSMQHRAIYYEVQREAMLALLDCWDAIIARARQLGRPVVCLGD